MKFREQHELTINGHEKFSLAKYKPQIIKLVRDYELRKNPPADPVPEKIAASMAENHRQKIRFFKILVAQLRDYQRGVNSEDQLYLNTVVEALESLIAMVVFNPFDSFIALPDIATSKHDAAEAFEKQSKALREDLATFQSGSQFQVCCEKLKSDGKGDIVTAILAKQTFKEFIDECLKYEVGDEIIALLRTSLFGTTKDLDKKAIAFVKISLTAGLMKDYREQLVQESKNKKNRELAATAKQALAKIDSIKTFREFVDICLQNGDYIHY